MPQNKFGLVISCAAWLLSLGLAGCADWESYLHRGSSAKPESTAEATAAAASSQPSGAVDLEVTKLWKDPIFQKQFVAGYGINAEVEPRVTVEEVAILEKILPFMADNLPKAQELLEKEMASLAKENTSPNGLAIMDFTLGQINFQRDKMDEALACFKKAVTKFPSFRRAWRNLGLIHARNSRFDDAISDFTKMIELGGGDGFSYGLLGYAYASKQDYQAAEVAYRNALLLQPQNTEWRLGLTRCVFREKKFEDAATLLDVLIERYPDKEDFWLLQANTYLGMKQPLKAAQNLEAVDRMGKADADNLYMLGDIYVSEDLVDLAAGAYCRAIDADAKVLHAAATQPARQPESQPALSATSQPETQPASQLALRSASQATSQATSRPGASPESQLLAKSLRSAEVLATRGAVTQARQVAEHIRQVWEKQIQGGDRSKLLKLEARLSMAGSGGGPETAKVLEEIVELDPLDGEALMLLGQHYSRQNEPDRAMLYYERAEGIEAFEASAKIRHAQVLVGMRPPRYADAVPLLRRAQELKPREDVARYLEQVERFARASPQTPAASIGERAGPAATSSAPASPPVPAAGK